MPTPPAATPPETAADGSAAPPQGAADGVDYLDQVMAEIDAEVRRRRASGDLPAGLERELDELFLEFSPVGLQGRARLRETLALVDGAAYVDIAVPVASEKPIGTYVKRLLRTGLGWYLRYIVDQVVKFAWAVSRMLHVVVDHVEELEAAVESTRSPDLPVEVARTGEPATDWWRPVAIEALAGVAGRVVHGDCGDGSLVAALVAAGVDAYGVDPSEPALAAALDDGLDVRAEPVLDHLEVVADEALGGLVLSGSVQWLRPNERQRLVDLAASRLTPGGVLVLHSATPASWAAGAPTLVRDLAPGRPLHAGTWAFLLAGRGFSVAAPLTGGPDRTLARVGASTPDADTVNAAIDAINELLLGPGAYLLVATRER